MPNKHFCQGPECHTQCTTDRYLKSKGIIRGRYAYAKIDESRYYQESDKYFCSQGCKNEWLNTNMESIQRRTLPPFIEHRRISEGYEKRTTSHEGWQGKMYTSSSIQKIGVDNDNQ
jgi:hypothetical protein